ncbi:hypothetical protein HYV11_03760 [Candidatus Dependentiae bacterium]|nr:hypothetical protein [Candidatus Dependentiae bacterium]
MIKKKWQKIIIYCVFAQQMQATLVTGDPDATSGNTFSFNVGFAKYNYGEAFSRLWLASGENISTDAAKPFALSYVMQIPAEELVNVATQQIIVPFALPMASPDPATIFSYNSATGKVDTSVIANPIYGAQFALFDTYNGKPVFVMNAALNMCYSVLDIEYQAVLSEGKSNKTELLSYNLGDGQEAKALLGTNDGVYIAYANGVFGTATSMIAKLVQSGITQKKSSNKSDKSEANFYYLQNIAQAEVSTATPALCAGGSALAGLGSSINFGNFPASGVSYVGVHATASAGLSDRAVGAMIMATTLVNNAYYALSFLPIVDNNAVSGSFPTVVSAPSNGTVRIINAATMQTSTSLSYLVVARDAGVGPQAIYAVPILATGSDVGKIADATSVVTTFGKEPSSYSARNFTKVLTDADQIDIANPTDFTDQITVGAGAIPLASGDIKDLYVVGDSVYVVIGSSIAAGTQPGTFFSQALFAQDGHIIGWTPWARVMGSDEPMLFSFMGSQSTVNFYVAGDGTDFKQVVHTQWGVNQNLSLLFSPLYMAKGGTQGIFSFGASTPGFNNALSLLITTGYNKVTIGQTGYSPAPSEFAVKKMTSSDVVTFDNVVNNTALVAAELATDGVDHWLFVGGASGLAVLTGDATGYTWTGNVTDVSGFNVGQTWKKVGDFSYVKKLSSDSEFLYVLTRDSFYKIDLKASNFTSSASVVPISIFTAKDFFKKLYFLDFIIDQNFCIVGTTNGLYSCDILSGIPLSINQIKIPDGLSTVSQLLVFSESDNPQKSFKAKSNLLVLNNNFETQQARINRFVIDDGTITPFDDALFNNAEQLNGIPTSFIRFSQYYSNYFTNGSWNLASNYFLGVTQPSTVISAGMLQLFSGIKNGRSSSHILLPLLSAQVPTKFLAGNNLFLGVIRESTSGAFIASGSFVARINA